MENLSNFKGKLQLENLIENYGKLIKLQRETSRLKLLGKVVNKLYGNLRLKSPVTTGT